MIGLRGYRLILWRGRNGTSSALEAFCSLDQLRSMLADFVHADRIYMELSDIFNRTVDELLPPPVFPTFDLDVPVGQLPASLPFTDPIIPDMHPTAFLFSLHRLSLQRENELLKSRLLREHQRTVAKKLYEAEVLKIEEEYELAKRSVQESLVDVVEEKRRMLWAEKEAEIGPSSIPGLKIFLLS